METPTDWVEESLDETEGDIGVHQEFLSRSVQVP